MPSSEYQSELRHRAEQLLATGQLEDDLPAGQDLRELLHELHVHHTELQLQNQELAEAQRRAQTASRRYQVLFDLAPVAYVMLDRKGKLVDVNHAAVSMFRLSRHQLANTALAFFVDAKDQVRYHKHLQQVLHGQAGENLEIHLHRSDHTQFAGLLTGTLVPACDDGQQQVLFTLTDISDMKLAEQRHLRQQEQLRQAQKMEAIGRLAGGIAHDFNNLLAGILGHAELLYAASREENTRNYAQTIIKTADRAAVLTRNLLTFSRKCSRQDVTVDLHALIRDVIELLSHTLDRRIEIRCELDADQPRIKGDPSLLQTALLNLCLNARDAMPEGGVLTVATESAMLDRGFWDERNSPMREGPYLVVTVRDTGVGMDEQTRSRVFEPFYSTKGLGKGTGLGLSMVYGTVRDHKGAVDVESTPGQGTTFSLFLPVTSPRDPAKPAPDGGGPARGGTLLLVDDEEVVRDMAYEALTRSGYEVITACDGVEAVETYREQTGRIDLVILDAIMPRMDGRQALREMRQINPDVRAIMSSGFALDMREDDLRAEGFSGFIEKPYRLSVMLERIGQCLTGSAAPAE